MQKFSLTLLLLVILPNIIAGQNMWQDAIHNVEYKGEIETTFSDHATPLWMNANKYGVSGTKGNFGLLKLGIKHDTYSDSLKNWRIGYQGEVVIGYGLDGNIAMPTNLYADIEYKKVRISAGIKERPAMMKNNQLSSGSFTFGTNAAPIPQIRFEVPEYISITGKSNWAAIKGHFGYGWMTDGKWQKQYIPEGGRYARKAKYHSKAGYLRVGNANRFPLTFEGGLEMACQFGGDIYHPWGRDGVFAEKLHIKSGVKEYINAIFGLGSDATDEEYANAGGNTVGSWLMALKYHGKNWNARLYYDHYFDDHSMMFFQYGWKDGLLGLEVELPKNPICGTLVYEYLNTTYQSGPIYHDHTDAIPDQISGVDNYYNHNLYQGWQHWGQGIGNPLITSPLYKDDGTLNFSSNRIRAHHVGLSGTPIKGLNYRLLYSHTNSWGTYATPFSNIRRQNNFLCELSYDIPFNIKNIFTKPHSCFWATGWKVKAAYALDRGKLTGNSNGFMLGISKSGWLIK